MGASFHQLPFRLPFTVVHGSRQVTVYLPEHFPKVLFPVGCMPKLASGVQPHPWMKLFPILFAANCPGFQVSCWTVC